MDDVGTENLALTFQPIVRYIVYGSRIEYDNRYREIMRAVEFLDTADIPYCAYGSAVLSGLGLSVIPDDLDVIVLEEDERNRLRYEFMIDRFNDGGGLKIDDKASRLGVVYPVQEGMIIHSVAGPVLMSNIAFKDMDGLLTLSVYDLLYLSCALIAGKEKSDVKGMKTISRLCQLGADMENMRRLTFIDFSPRDLQRRTFSQFKELIDLSMIDLERFGFQQGVTVDFGGAHSFLKYKYAVHRVITGRAVIPFVGFTKTGNRFTGFDDCNKFEYLYQRWMNFGRNIQFYDVSNADR